MGFVESQNRRTFIATAGITVASLVSSRLTAQTDNAPKAPPVPATGARETVAGMSADHPTLVSYRKAIGAMQKLDATKPLSWSFQANMHGTAMADGKNEAWRWCMHGNWWFLPWHRGYIYFFEKIIRKMSGDDRFCLPYWPWEEEGENVLPVAFRSAMYQNKKNALFDATRSDAAKNGQPLRPGMGSFSADWQKALATKEFTTQIPALSYGGIRAPKTTMLLRPTTSRRHGAMESLAHDMIHDAVGGEAGNMGDPDTAARDPIFWLHHANVDRLWNKWLEINGHLLPDQVADHDWYEQQFPYYDETGVQVVVSVKEILDRASKETRYDDRKASAVAAQGPREKTVPQTIVELGSVQPMLSLNTKPVIKTLAFVEEQKPKLMTALTAPSEPATVLLQIEGIKPPTKAPLSFEVFLTKKGDPTSKASYVGPISFFGRRGDGDHHGQAEKDGFTQGFDVTRLIQKLRSANGDKLPDIDVSVVPHSLAGLSDADLAKENINIPISNITLKLVTSDKN